MASLVDRATSDLLFAPDWAMNLEICDVINYDPGQACEVVKAIKKRLGNKDCIVQLLALTVLDTIMKNCGESVHQNVAEEELLNEMIKIVKRKSDVVVRDKMLVLLDSWREAFGRPSCKYPQYYMAYDELRRVGVEFPERSHDAAPIFTPPSTYVPPPHQHPSYGSNPQSYRPYVLPPLESYGSLSPYLPARLDAVKAATDVHVWGSKDMDGAQSGLEVLNEMLNTIEDQDRQRNMEESLFLPLLRRRRDNPVVVEMEKCEQAMKEHATSLERALREHTSQIQAQLNAGFSVVKIMRGTDADHITPVLEGEQLERLSSSIQAMLDISRTSTDHLSRFLLLLRSIVCDYHGQEAQRLKKALDKAEAEKSAHSRRSEAEKAALQASLLAKTEECNRLEAEMAAQEVSLREELQACQICMTKPRNVVLVPCLHAHFCADCLDVYRKQDTNNNGCPTCRSAIRDTFPYIS